MKRALITGVSGFTGRYLAQELTAHGYHVAGITHSPLSLLLSGVHKLYTADLFDTDELLNILTQEVPDVVVHLAAISFVAHGDVEDIYRTNILGTHHLLEAIAQVGNTPHLLLASSANVYGNSSVSIISEEVPLMPANDYAVSKLAMEYMAKLWADRIPITLVRPFNYTGVGQRENFLIPKIVKHFAQRIPILELGNTNVERDFSDVRSVVTAYRCLLELSGKGNIYNVCSGRGHTLMQVIDMMEEISGFRPKLRINPAFVRGNEVKKLIGNNQSLIQEIGTFPFIELRETLRWMWQSSVELT